MGEMVHKSTCRFSRFLLRIIHQNKVFLTFSDQQRVRVIHKGVLYTEDYSTWYLEKKVSLLNFLINL